jgi:23S rRNA pseudouridine2457 synthase
VTGRSDVVLNLKEKKLFLFLDLLGTVAEVCAVFRVEAKQIMLILFNKPFQVMSQFSPLAGKRTLADFIDITAVYPAGRLDYDSEGLLLLTDDGRLQQRLSDPRFKQWKTYWVQVEGVSDAAALAQWQAGVMLKDGLTLPAHACSLPEPADLWPRLPPIRERAHIPTAWIELRIREGRNRQVRRMTAALGYPCLRLVRYAVGEYTLDGLAPGAYRIQPGLPS